MKRGGKRSHVGVRVSAMSNDGYFYPGTIRGIKPRPGARVSGMMSTADVVYQVAMDAGGDVHEFTHGMIVAPGFTPVSNVHLKFNQPVYASLNGREVRAIVQRHRKETNEVLLKTSDESETDFKMKLDDVRLLDSRRSMTSGNEYLLKHHHHHHHHDDVEAKKRPVSTSIEVPSSSPKSQKVQEAEPPMDDVMAAMVLTSLSGSPLVRRERNPSGDSVLSTGTGPMSPASSLSSGYGNVSPSPSPSTTTGGHFTWDAVRNTPSPASSNSDMESSPCPLPPFSTAQGSIPKSSAMTISSPLFSSSVDEGIDISGGGIPFTLEDATPCSPNKKFKYHVHVCAIDIPRRVVTPCHMDASDKGVVEREAQRERCNTRGGKVGRGKSLVTGPAPASLLIPVIAQDIPRGAQVPERGLKIGGENPFYQQVGWRVRLEDEDAW